jgi:N-acetylglucosamine-6-phosphate deacetylase
VSDTISRFVDLQVNGYGGVDFNTDALTDENAAAVCERLAADGVKTALATIITAPLDAMIGRIGRLADLIETMDSFAEVIGGIHVEGPFINPADGFVGAHPPTAVSSATSEITERLLAAGRGHVKLFTLAPEMDSGAAVTRMLTDRGIVVAAGHSDASIDQLQESVDAGLKLFTHLGNGCPGQMHRHDNIVQRVLSLADQLSISFIADGHHVPAFALRNYLRIVPDENIIIVSDAISAAGLGPGRYELSDQIVEVDENGAAWSADRKHFAGCATTLPEMVTILRDKLDIDPSDSIRWMTTNPARLLSLTS